MLSHVLRRSFRSVFVGGWIGVCGGVWCAPAFAQDAEPEQKPAEEFRQKARNAVRERGQLYRTVWKDEVAAQVFETAFVELWDALRSGGYSPELLRKFPLREITLGRLDKARVLENGVERQGSGGEAQTLSHAEWSEWIAGLSEQGYRLEKCEFHHKRFSRDSEGAAVSDLSLAFYVTRGGTRLVVSGTIQVIWRGKPDADGRYYPDTIDARQLRIVRRDGAPVFLETFSEPKASLQSATLIVRDLDEDGDPDLVDPQSNRLYRNDGTGNFGSEQLTQGLGVGDTAASVIADFTGDGLGDLLLTARRRDGYSRLGLVEGVPGGLASEVRWLEIDGLELIVPTVVSAGDVDGDGDVDAWIAQYKAAYLNGQMPTPYFDANDGFPSYLLLNDGAGGLSDATAQAGLGAKRLRRTYSGSLVDLDADDDLDLVVVSDFSGVDLYENDGSGHFLDVTDSIDNRSLFGMSHALADFNGDGALDFYVSGMGSTTARRLEQLGLGRDEFPEHNQMRMQIAYGNRIYLAEDGALAYRQPAYKDNVARTGWSWGCVALDFDCDGDRDIYVGNGHESRTTSRDYCSQFWCLDVYSGSSKVDRSLDAVFRSVSTQVRDKGISWNGFEKNHLLVNLNGTDLESEGFVNMAFAMGAAFERDTRHVATADVNSDGRPDLILSFRDAIHGTESIHVFRNDFRTQNHWVGVRVAGARGVSPLGAKVTCVARSGRRQVAQIVTGDSYRVQHPPVCHFGLGADDAIEFVEIRWLNGQVKRLDNPKIDQYHTVKP